MAAKCEQAAVAFGGDSVVDQLSKGDSELHSACLVRFPYRMGGGRVGWWISISILQNQLANLLSFLFSKCMGAFDD